MTKYSWRYKDDKSRDIRVYEIRRAFTIFNDDNVPEGLDTSEIPFTVVLHRYSQTGDKPLFSDLFYCDDWDENRGSDGKTSHDVRFCCSLWEDLGLHKENGPFTPSCIEHDLQRAPAVYRNKLENVMNIRYGCGHQTFLDSTGEPTNQEEKKTIKAGFEKISL